MLDKSQIKPSNPGDFIKVGEYNLVKDFVKSFRDNSSAPQNSLANRPLVVFNDSALDIPPYSLLSINGDDSGVTHFAEPKVARIASTTSNGAPNLFLTNNANYLPAYSKGLCYLIGDNSPVYLRSSSTEVGKLCGPSPGTNIISSDYTGFICLSNSSIKNVDSGACAWFTTTGSNSHFAGFVTSQINPYDSGTNTLGTGTVKLYFGSSSILAMKDPADIANDYEVPVKSLSQYLFAVDEPVLLHYVAGMGLVAQSLVTHVDDYCTFVSNVECNTPLPGYITFTFAAISVENGAFVCTPDVQSTVVCVTGGGGGSTSSSTSTTTTSSSSSDTQGPPPPSGSASFSECDPANPGFDPCKSNRCGWICMTSNSHSWQSTGIAPLRTENIPFGFDQPNLVLEGDGTNFAEMTYFYERVPASNCFFYLRYKHTIDADMLSADFAAADWFTNRLDVDFDERDFDNLDFLTEASVFGAIEIKQNGISIANIPLPYQTDIAPTGSETILFLNKDHVAMVKIDTLINIDPAYQIEFKLRGPTERGIQLVFDALRMRACPEEPGSIPPPSSSSGSGSASSGPP